MDWWVLREIMGWVIEGPAKVPNPTFGICLCFLLRRIIFSLYVSKFILILFIRATVDIFLVPWIQ